MGGAARHLTIMTTMVAGLLATAAVLGSPPAAAEVEALIRGYQEAFAAWVVKVSSATDPAERDALISQQPDKDELGRRLLELAQRAPGEQAALLALRWTYIEVEDEDLRDVALAALRRDFGDDERIRALLPALERDEAPRARAVLEQLVASHPSPAARCDAAMALASWLLAFGAPGDRPRAEQLLERTVADCADVAALRGGTLGEQADARLFELRRLAIGATAPEIEDVDLHGERLRLSDHRGKVVLLTFWAHWCSGCMVQAEAERELLGALAERPFAVVGVNADPAAPDEVLELNRRKEVGWRSFRNGSAGPRGPITRRWNVRTLPTTYIIDHEGRIVAKWVATIARKDELLAAVEPAVMRAEQARAAEAASSNDGR